ncbi:MAG: EamA family transporter [Myxococcota bacterium]
MRARRLYIGLAFAAVYLIWGSTFFGIRIAVEQIPPLFLAGNRFVVAGVAVLAWSAWCGKSLRDVRLRDAIIPGLLFFAAANGAVSWAESRGLPSSTAAILIASEPLWVAVLQRVVTRGHTPLSWAHRLGLLGGFAGTAALVGGTPAGVDPFAAAVVLVGAAAWALGSVLVARRAGARDRQRPVDPVALAGLQMLVGGIACFVGAAVLGESAPEVSGLRAQTVGAFAYLVVFGSIIGFLAYSYLLRNVAPSSAATYAYANPVVAVILGSLVGEPLEPRTLAAMALVIVSVALTVRPATTRLPKLPRIPWRAAARAAPR